MYAKILWRFYSSPHHQFLIRSLQWSISKSDWFFVSFLLDVFYVPSLIFSVAHTVCSPDTIKVIWIWIERGRARYQNLKLLIQHWKTFGIIYKYTPHICSIFSTAYLNLGLYTCSCPECIIEKFWERL